MHSAIYEGTIRHRRYAERRHEFTHRLAMAYIDLEEAPELLAGRLMRSTPGLVRFRRRDYLGDPSVPLADAVRALVEQEQGTAPVGPIRLLTQLRTLGHCFNPVSFYYCFAPDGERLRAIVAEVTNTPWGERHAYVLEGDGADAIAKAMHVSPFMGMGQRYSFRAPAPGRSLGVHIESKEHGERRVFDATLSLRRRPFIEPHARPRHRALPSRNGADARLDLWTRDCAEAQGRADPSSPKSAALMTPRVARRAVLWMLSHLREGRLTLIEDEHTTVFGAGSPSATVRVNSPRMWAMLLTGSRGLGRSYSEGLWDAPDITAVVRLAARNVEGLDRLRRRLAPIRAPYHRLRGLFARNTPARSRKDIAAHYDLGNELFARMLDPTLMYSCAVFTDREATLEQASVAKLELVCEKLSLGPSDRVLEIGTGWGTFAVYAASTRGCHVTTTTLSREQYEVARARIREAGVEHLVDLRLDDYRDLRGSYDKLVSIEMIEAVGWRDFGTFFKRCSKLLAPGGLMLLQAITMDDRAYEVEKASRSFIRTYIFPNGCLPSLEVIARCVRRHTDLRTVHLEGLTPHYVETLRRWRANFEAAAEELERYGYDERFRRLWRMYLAYSEAGFAERRIGLVQTLLAKPRWRGESFRVVGPGGPGLAGEDPGAHAVEQERRAA